MPPEPKQRTPSVYWAYSDERRENTDVGDKAIKSLCCLVMLCHDADLGVDGWVVKRKDGFPPARPKICDLLK